MDNAREGSMGADFVLLCCGYTVRADGSYADVVDVGTDEEYDAYFAAHLVPRLTDPDEPMVAEDDDDEDDKDKGGGRWRRQRRGVARRVVRGRSGQRDARERAKER